MASSESSSLLCGIRCQQALALLTLVLCCDCAHAAVVQLNPLFSDHMVMQQGMPLPVWGRAEPGENVTVTIDQQIKTTQAAATGAWLVHLDALGIGPPRNLLVMSSSGSLTIHDVLIGEVWLGSGQSNMELSVSLFAKGDPVLAEAATKGHPRLRLFTDQGWQEATPENQAHFSAQLFYYGLSLQRELDVPVGLICRAVSGSPSVPWLSEEAFHADAALQHEIVEFNKAHPNANAENKLKYEAKLAEWEEKYSPATLKNAVPATGESLAPHFKPEPPYLVDGTGKRGVFYEKLIRPLIPYGIRGVLWDQGENGTGMAGVANNNSVLMVLIRSWRKDWGEGDFPFLYVEKGGAGCALNPNDPINRGATTLQPMPPNPWPWSPKVPDLRDVPSAFMVATTDLDHSGSHPFNKSGYGARDCQVALRAVYGKPGEYAGPTYASCSTEGSKLRVAFIHATTGLACPENQQPQGFAIAGADNVWVWADAVMDGSTVLLSSSKVMHPVSVQYRSSSWTNLFNRDGLPATSFRGGLERAP